MLLDRKRTKFWQRIVFIAMAVLLVVFLVAPSLAGDSLGCGGESASTDQFAQEIKTYKAAVTADPADPQAWRDLADAYVTQVEAQHGQDVPYTAQQTAQLALAVKAYRKSAKLWGEQTGTDAKTERAATLEDLAGLYDRLGQYDKAVRVFGDLTELQPRNADYFFGLANAAINAGDTNNAVLAFQRFLELAPNDPLAPDVKAWIEENTKGGGQ